jgi:hypothetical protein
MYCTLRGISRQVNLFLKSTLCISTGMRRSPTPYDLDKTPPPLCFSYSKLPSPLLFLHCRMLISISMYYHFAILLLFRPFIKLNIVDSSISPRDVCSQAAEAISALVCSYSRLYSTPSFVPCFVLTSSITHLATLGTTHGNPKQVHQGISDLQSMADCHEFANRGRDILLFLADNWQVDITTQDRASPSRFGSKQGPKDIRPTSEFVYKSFCSEYSKCAYC